MINQELVAPCGLYCGVCGIYCATASGDQPLKEKLAKAAILPTKLIVVAACPIRFTGTARFAPSKAVRRKRDTAVAINAQVSPAIKSRIFRCRRERKIFCVPSQYGKNWARKRLLKAKKNFLPATIAALNFSAGPENAVFVEH